MQDEDYGLSTARHYAAYRPPLHVAILALGLRDDERFLYALDVGCGAGSSTHALQGWCDRVIGRDPSAAMIELSHPTASISFQQQPGEKIDSGLEQNVFDLVTFAGSLFYLDTNAVLTSLERLLTPDGKVIVYDFDVLLQPVFELLGTSMPAGDYNHLKKIPSTGESFLKVEKSTFGKTSFEVNSTQLAHLLYSVSAWRKGPLANLGFTELVDELPPTTTLEAKMWLTSYAC